MWKARRSGMTPLCLPRPCVGRDQLLALAGRALHGCDALIVTESRALVRYILNTPKRGAGGIGASRQAVSASPSTSRVCTGSITPSSHRRAVA